MDRYQRVEKPREESAIGENEIRITTRGLIRNYTSYATSLLQEERVKEIMLKAMGQAISKTVTIAEIIKKRIPGLHQDTVISSISITDVWEPIEEGLIPLEMTRHVSVISITLSTLELHKNSPGYQPPTSFVRQRRPRYQQQQRNTPEERVKEIVLKAMGQAISKTVTIAEIIKKRIPGLHQDTVISSISITDVWEPIEEGLIPLEMTRHVSMISITLSTLELHKNSPGYQPPTSFVRQRRPRYQQQQRNTPAPMANPPDAEDPCEQGEDPYGQGDDSYGPGAGSYGRGRGRSRGRGRGWGRSYINNQENGGWNSRGGRGQGGGWGSRGGNERSGGGGGYERGSDDYERGGGYERGRGRGGGGFQRGGGGYERDGGGGYQRGGSGYERDGGGGFQRGGGGAGYERGGSGFQRGGGYERSRGGGSLNRGQGRMGGRGRGY